MVIPNTDVTLIAVCSIPTGRGYSPITLRCSNDGTSITNFRLDISIWYDSENLTDKLAFYILSTDTSIEKGNDLDVVLNLQKVIGIARVGDLAGKKFCLMLEGVHTGQHNIYINGVLIYNYVDTSPIVSNFSVGKIRIGAPNTGANNSSNVYYGAALLRQLTDTERIQYVEAQREAFKF